MGTRATGMGEAFTGVADDTAAIYYNPAGLTQMQGPAVNFTQIIGFGGINYSYLALASPAEAIGIDVWGNIGFAYELISIEDIARTKTNRDAVADGIPLPPGEDLDAYSLGYANKNYMFTSAGTVVSLSYAWQATKAFSLGGTVKMVNEKVDAVDGWGFAGDLGLFTRTPLIPGLGAGLSVQNIGKSPGSAPLPVMLRAGVSYDWLHPFSPPNRPVDELYPAFDVVLPIVPVDGSIRIDVGMEYKRYFGTQYGVFRLGYRFPQDLGALAGMTAGLAYGIDFAGASLSLDYAFVPYGDLGMSHRIGLSGDFGSKPKLTPVAEPAPNPPTGLQASAGDRRAQLYWSPNLDPIGGYNVYLAYKLSGPWYKLTPKPIQVTSQSVGSLYNNVTTYLVVTAVNAKDNKVESKKSMAVMVVPKAAGMVAPAPRPAARATKPAAKPTAKPAAKPAKPTRAKGKPATPSSPPPMSGPPPLP
jgi:hypothetical protein